MGIYPIFRQTHIEHATNESVALRHLAPLSVFCTSPVGIRARSWKFIGSKETGETKKRILLGGLKHFFYFSLIYWECHHPNWLPSGYLTVSHGKIHPFFIGKPSISMGHLSYGYVSHNQRVIFFRGVQTTNQDIKGICKALAFGSWKNPGIQSWAIKKGATWIIEHDVERVRRRASWGGYTDIPSGNLT